jgi:hypothetical protein
MVSIGVRVGVEVGVEVGVGVEVEVEVEVEIEVAIGGGHCGCGEPHAGRHARTGKSDRNLMSLSSTTTQAK